MDYLLYHLSLIHILFCDIAINEDETHFSVYKAIKQALMERGIPEKEICFAGDAKTDKADLPSLVEIIKKQSA